MAHKKTIVWFRQDLRITDNPALAKACEDGDVLCVYIMDQNPDQDWSMGAASKVWLHHSLQDLNKSLNGHLHLFEGPAFEVLSTLVQAHAIDQIYWNRCYEPDAIERDKSIKTAFKHQNIPVQSFNASLLWEPWEIAKKDGTPYKVFTPFYRKGCLGYGAPRPPMEAPKNKTFINLNTPARSLDELGLLPKGLNWPSDIIKGWEISEKGAMARLNSFIENGLSHYKNGRNIPSKPYVSRLSPYLHFGQISPHQIWARLEETIENKTDDKNRDHFKSELGWREFSYSLLFYNPSLMHNPIQPKFETFPWVKNDTALEAWKRGQTGIPIVDAGMRELWQTGFMHNRVRMIVGSFLVKNLLIHWQEGEKWFWDCLFDADLANNSASWQWIAGCGADAAPYFRIFNPISQSEKFDPQGDYIRTYVPELKDLPEKFLFAPWDAPLLILKEAGVELGVTYPHPLVDLKKSRNQALEAFTSLKQAS